MPIKTINFALMETQELTAQDIKFCLSENLYCTFMQVAKGMRFYDRKSKVMAHDKAQVYWSVALSKHLRDELLTILTGTNDRWGVIIR